MQNLNSDLQARLDSFNERLGEDSVVQADMLKVHESGLKDMVVDTQQLNPDLQQRVSAMKESQPFSEVDDDGFISKALDVPKQAVGGFRDAAESMKNLVFDVAGEGAKLLYVDALGIATDEEVDGLIDGKKDATSLPEVGEAKSAVGGITRSVSQFLAPFGVLSKAKYMQKLGKAAPVASGVLADFVAFEEHEQRLSNVVNDVGWGNAVTEYLAADENDSWAEGRFKNALEGAGLGLAMDGVFHGVRYIKETRRVKNLIKESQDLSKPRVAEIQKAGKEAAAVREELRGFDPKSVDVNKFRPNKETVSLNAQKRMASAIGTDVDELVQGDVYKKIKKMGVQDRLNKVTLLEEESFAKTSEALKEAIARADAGDAKAASDFWMNEGASFLEVAGAAKDAHQEVARALGARGNSHAVVATNKIIERLAKASTETQEDMMRAFANLADPNQADVFLSNVGKKGIGQLTKETVNEFYINSILSSPKTLAVDTVASALWTPWLAVEKLPAGAVGFLRHKVGGASGDRVFMDEAGVMLKSYMGSISDAWSFVARAAAREDGDGALSEVAKKFSDLQIDSQTRFDTPRGERAISSANYGIERDSLLGRSVDMASTVINAPTTFMQAKDDVTKAILYRGEVRALAHRKALQEGLSGPAYHARVKQLIDTPLDKVSLGDQTLSGNPLGQIARGLAQGDDSKLVGSAIDSQARQFAREGTFTDDLGPAMQSIQRAIGQAPGGKIIIPFVKTPTKIMVRFLERTPAGLAFKHVRSDLAAGGARADMAMGRMVAGSSLMTMGWMLASGGIVTGEGPKDKAERDSLLRAGWRPRSIRVGDKYYEYGRLDPLSSFFSMAANMVELNDELHNELGASLEKDMSDYFAIGGLAFSNMMLSKTWTQSVAQLLDAVNRQDEDAVQRLVNFYGSSLAVPNAVTFFANEVNPIMQNANSLWEQIQIKAGKEVRPKLDVFGEVVKRDPQMFGILPSSHSNIVSDPLHRKLAEDGAFLPMPDRRIDGVEITRDQHQAVMLKMKEMGVKKAIRKLVDSPLYENLPDQNRTGVPGLQRFTKSGMVLKLYSDYVKMAKESVKAEDVELKLRIDKFKKNLQTESAGVPVVNRALQGMGIPSAGGGN